MTWTRLVIFAAVCALAAPVVASAQQKPPAASTDDDPDRDPNRSQPDFTLVNLPTTLRVPKYKSAFRVTHRFARPLGQGDFSDLAEDLFGLDSGAQIGLDTGSVSCEVRRSASTARATGRSSSSRSTAGCSRKTTDCSAWTSSRRWTAQTTSATVIHRHWVLCCRASSAATARSTSSRSG